MKTSGNSGIRAGILLAAALATPAGLGGIPSPVASEPHARKEQLRAAASKEEVAAALERLVPRLMKDGDVPGLALAVVKDGRVTSATTRPPGLFSRTFWTAGPRQSQATVIASARAPTQL